MQKLLKNKHFVNKTTETIKCFGYLAFFAFVIVHVPDQASRVIDVLGGFVGAKVLPKINLPT